MRRTLLLTWALSFALSVGWALVTPLYGSPDAWAHEAKAYAVAHGQFIPDKWTNPDAPSAGGFGLVQSPHAWALRDMTNACFRFKPEVTPDCSPPVSDDRTISDTATSAGRYPPPYYFVTGLPSLLMSPATASWGMRAVGALVTSFFVAWAAVAAMTRRRPGIALAGVAVATTPAVTYLAGTVNPNALEITAGLATIACGVAAVQDDRPWLSSIMMRRALISAAVLVSGRIVAPVWLVGMVLILAVVVPFADWRRVLALFRRPLFVVAFLSGVAIVVWSRTVGALDPAAPAEVHPLRWRLRTSYDYILTINNQYLGSFGWFEVRTPESWTPVALWALGLLLLLLAVASRRPGRIALASLGTVAMLIAVPTLVTASTYDALGGAMWQARYALPLAVALPVVAAFVAADHWRLRRDSVLDWVARALVALVIALSAYLHGWSHVAVLRRFVSAGQSAVDGPWQPPFGARFDLVLNLGVVGIAAGLVLFVLLRPYSQERTSLQ